MSKAILNKRDRMLWDNSFKPDGVNDTLDLVSEHIEDIVEDHIEGVGKRVNHYLNDYKQIVSLTFDEHADALNIDFEKEYNAVIIRYVPVRSTETSGIKVMYIKTNFSDYGVNSNLFDGSNARGILIDTRSVGHAIFSKCYYNSPPTGYYFSVYGGVYMSYYDVTKDIILKGVRAAISIEAGSKIEIYGVEV